MPRRFLAWSLILGSFAPAFAQSEGVLPIVGTQAPPYFPQQWANATKPITPGTFRGRAVLVVRWGTQCPFCVKAIPKLNEMTEKLGKLGLRVVGIADEPLPVVRAYAEEHKLKYLVGSGGANGYIAPRIPEAWLITPKGVVAWQGSPLELKNEILERVVKWAVAAPEFDLPPSLRDSQAALNLGQYAQALRLLKRAEDSNGPAAEAAREAKDQVTGYGASRLEQAKRYAENADYPVALEILAELTRGFTGNPVAEQARNLTATWRKDPKIRVEIEADQMLGRAEEFLLLRQNGQAATILQQLTRTPKYANTKAREKALAILNPPPASAPAAAN